MWHVQKVAALVANDDAEETFFCGGSRNFPQFIELFDAVFVLTVDRDTLIRRLDERNSDDSEWHPAQGERELIERLHATGEGTPPGIAIDATAPIARVVDAILEAIALRQLGDDPPDSTCTSGPSLAPITHEK